MAHDLEIVNGVASMFSARSLTPWHKLGHVVDSVATAAEAIRLAGQDFRVNVEPVFTKDGQAIDGQFCTRRDTDGSVYGMVSDRYVPLQNVDAFAWADILVQAGEATYETAGSLRGGARTWLMLKLNGGQAKVGGVDAIERFMLLSNSHDGKKAVKAGFADNRVVCANTLAQAEGSAASKLLRIRHSAKMLPALEDIRVAMDTVRSEFKAQIEVYDAMANKGISKKDLEKYVCKVFDASPEDPPRAMTQIVENFDRGIGSDIAGSTVWGAYNACTDYLTHSQGRTDEGRLDANMYGTSVAVNQAALNYAYNFVNTGAF